MRFTKNEYQQRLKTYVDRRTAMRASYGKKWKESPEYKLRVRRINVQIKGFKRAIRRYTEIENKIREKAWVICEFLDINLLRGARPLRYTVSSRDEKIKKGRNLLYKWALEEGIGASYVSWWVGAAHNDTASRGRMRFTRSFQTKPENRGLWNHFKLYLNTSRAVDGGLKKAVAA